MSFTRRFSPTLSTSLSTSLYTSLSRGLSTGLHTVLLGSLTALLAPGVASAAVCTLTVGSPADGSVQENSPTFTWTAGSACTNMRVQLSDDPAFLRRVTNTTWSAATSVQLAEATWNTQQAGRWASGVYWRVQGKNRWGAVTSTAVGHLVMDPDYDDDGVSVGRGDCDDRAAAIYLGAPELCDGLDNDCDGSADDGLSTQTVYTDLDGDTHGDPGVTLDLCSTDVPVGWSADNSDCDDAQIYVYPGAEELCNEVDDDCDGLIDDGLTVTTLYEDKDSDSFGDPASTLATCAPEEEIGWGWSAVDTDCDDLSYTAYPGAPEEYGDGRDQDCDGADDTFCADVDLGSDLGLVATGTTDGAAEDLSLTCEDGDAAELSYAWTAPGEAIYRVSATGDGYDPILGLGFQSYDTCADWAYVCDSSAGGGFLDVFAYGGETLLFAVQGRAAGSGDFSLEIVPDREVSCDDGLDEDDDSALDCDDADCASSLPCADICPTDDLGEATGAVASGDTTTDDDSLDLSCVPGGAPDAVRSWTAPEAGTWLFSLVGSGYDTALGLFTVGADTCGETEIACNDDYIRLDSGLSATLVAGQEVIVVIDGYDGDAGAWTLSVTRQ